MKILYSVQATGNGHISRAMELLPHLQKYGDVDIFLSGANSTLELDAPIKYRSRGISLFYTCKGSLDYWKLGRSVSPSRILKEAHDLPVEKYDVVLNDFESITALSCKLKKVPSIQFGHQASFQSSNTPRPTNPSRTGEWILKNYAQATNYLGLHFDRYDQFILGPVIKQGIVDATPSKKEHVTVYLPSYCFPTLRRVFQSIPDQLFEIFTDEMQGQKMDGNIRWMPVSKQLFNQSLIHCAGIITGGGFETPAEALFLGKKLIAIPIRGQYEQKCNAAALSKLGVVVLEKLGDDFQGIFEKWINNPMTVGLPSYQTIDKTVEAAMELAASIQRTSLAEA